MPGLGILGTPRCLCLLAACFMLAAFLSACVGGGTDAATDDRVLTLEANAHSLEESLEALQEENAELRSELASLRQEQADYVQAQEAASAAREHEEEVADFEEVQEEQLASLEEGQAQTGERLDGLESRLLELENVASQVSLVLPSIQKWTRGMEQRLELLEGGVIDRTVRLAEGAGGEVYFIKHPKRKEHAVLVMPLEPIEGNPLIVSLHGYGGNSADHALYLPLHERVIADGFGLILPNGSTDDEGRRFWNPAGPGYEVGKSDVDDFAYLSHVVAEARMLKEFGPVYFLGYSNGGFMSYWMACQGLPGLRAIVSLAGTSYVDDAECKGAPPVSVLHIHGTDDKVVQYDGVQRGSDKDAPGYAGAEEMVVRWASRAGCEWPEDPRAYGGMDLDEFVPGVETQVYRPDSGCAGGVSIELWAGKGSGHGPGYGDAFTNALLDWLLAQK